MVSELIESIDDPIVGFQPSFLQYKEYTHHSLASSIPAKLFSMKNSMVRESMSDPATIPHRLEFVATIASINFINDSKATNVNATWYALEKMTTKVVLVLGGVEKNNDYATLKTLVTQKVGAIVCIGRNNRTIHSAFENDIEDIINAVSMQEAVSMAYALAKKDETVLLSPACASFDRFKNYEDRGRQFMQAVKEL